MKFDLVIFDFDGTLADTYPWFAENLNHVADKFNFRKVQPHEQEALRQLTAQEILRFLGIPRYQLPRVVTHMRNLMNQDIHQIDLFEGVSEALQLLSESGVKLGLISSNKLNNVNRVLGTDAGLFNYQACGTSLFGKPRKINKLLRKARVRPSRCLFIGDEIRDADAARETGVKLCLVSWGYNHRNALADCTPDYLIDQITELEELFNPSGSVSSQ